MSLRGGVLMKQKIFLLMFVPLLIMAVELNEGATIWTQDQGFFKQYRQIKVRALNVDGDVIIWGRECEFPSRVLGFDPVAHSLVAQFNYFDLTLSEHIDETDIYLKGSLGSSWSTSSIYGYMVNAFSYHSAITSAYLVAATEAGVFHSIN
jgi:hypothetical protein